MRRPAAAAVLGEAEEEGGVGDAVGILVYLFCVAASTRQRASQRRRELVFVTFDFFSFPFLFLRNLRDE